MTNEKTKGGQFVIGTQALVGQIDQANRLTGVNVKRAYVDRGYPGHAVCSHSERAFPGPSCNEATARCQISAHSLVLNPAMYGAPPVKFRIDWS